MTGWGPPTPTYDDVIALHERLRRNFGVPVILGVELEFYTDASRADELLNFLQPIVLRENIELSEWEAEDGDGQWEVAIAYDALDVALPKFLTLKDGLIKVAQSLNIPLSFDAKPFHDQPASGLHLHVHLEDLAGNSVCTKNKEEMSAPFEQMMAGMLRMMPASMGFFMLNHASFERLREGEHVPAHVCWGMNNRSVALRIPEVRSEEKHVEHRVCGADADVISAVWAMLVGIEVGLSQKLTLPDPIYGMARDAHYDAPLLPQSVEQVQRAFEADSMMQSYIAELPMSS